LLAIIRSFDITPEAHVQASSTLPEKARAANTLSCIKVRYLKQATKNDRMTQQHYAMMFKN
jgi:hypothetical protein